MRKDAIVIITRELDPHVDAVIVRMQERGIYPIRLHTAGVFDGAGCAVRISNDSFGGRLHTGGAGPLSLRSIKSIWWRRPESVPRLSDVTHREGVFARREVSEALNGIWTSLDCYWMSRPDKVYAGSRKIEQLKRASEFGFRVPRTLVTNNKQEVIDFYEECSGRMIYKVLSTPDLALNSITGASYLIPRAEDTALSTKTTLVTSEMLKNNADAIAAAPCLFQEYVEKRVELRITMFEDNVFVAEIDSQAQEATKIDWRNYDVPQKLSKGALPHALMQKCIAYMRSYGLTFSCIDMIVTPDGDYVFVENNPNGQWMFVERCIPTFRMTDALIDCLIGNRETESVEVGIALK